MEPGLVAGVSITAAVAFRALVDKVQRTQQPKRARVPLQQRTRYVPVTSQESSVVTGNMVLANM